MTTKSSFKKNIKISGTGCILADYFYPDIDFLGKVFKKYRSRRKGDGGLNPGNLVFTENLETFANKNFDEIVAELTKGRAYIDLNIGGPGIIAMINVAQLLYNYNCTVNFFGAIGNDETGRFIKSSVEECTVNISGLKKMNERSAFTNVFSDPNFDNKQGERIFVNNIGAANLYNPEYLNDNFFDGDLLLFGGTALLPKIHDNLSELLLKGKKLGRINIVTTVFDFRNEMQYPDRPWPLGNDIESFKAIDLLITNRNEALGISGKKSIENAIRYFKELGVGCVIVTNGQYPIHIYSKGTVFKKCGVTEISVLPIIREKVNKSAKGDSTGCGDNFAGGVIASMAMQLLNEVKSLDLMEACAWGMASGAFANFYLGGMFKEQRQGEKQLKIFELVTRYKNYKQALN